MTYSHSGLPDATGGGIRMNELNDLKVYFGTSFIGAALSIFHDVLTSQCVRGGDRCAKKD